MGLQNGKILISSKSCQCLNLVMESFLGLEPNHILVLYTHQSQLINTYIPERAQLRNGGNGKGWFEIERVKSLV
jgi:hypothetical protein